MCLRCQTVPTWSFTSYYETKSSARGSKFSSRGRGSNFFFSRDLRLSGDLRKTAKKFSNGPSKTTQRIPRPPENSQRSTRGRPKTHRRHTKDQQVKHQRLLRDPWRSNRDPSKILWNLPVDPRRPLGHMPEIAQRLRVDSTFSGSFWFISGG